VAEDDGRAGSLVVDAQADVGGAGVAPSSWVTMGKLRCAPILARKSIRSVRICERSQATLLKNGGEKAKEFEDMRQAFSDGGVEAVSIATPNHWHALATIWACKAGKDVYCEKPASYNIHEGLKMLQVARETKKMVQIGSQHRSNPMKIKAMEAVKGGLIGKVYQAKGLCFKRRVSIGHKDNEPTPPGVNWDLFLGPAPMRPFNALRFKYNWHWFWDTGNGDIGNQGVHELDVARWGLGRGLPRSVVSTGGKFVYDDDQETPNTQIATFDYGDAELVCEVRGLNTGGEGNVQAGGSNFIGNFWLGSKGYLSLDRQGFQVFLGDKREPGESSKDSNYADTKSHVVNFLEAVRSRNYKDLYCDVAEGVTSAELVHLANTSYRLGRKLAFDRWGKFHPAKFAGRDPHGASILSLHHQGYRLRAG
jgi:predicted dehydrogenase